MAINLMGFVSGFAKGASERIDDEREKEETALANRFKLAAVNKMTREKEANELKGLYAERIKNFNAAYPEATEEEVIAAVSTENIYSNLMDAYNKKKPVDIKKHLYVNRDLIPEDFTDSLSYINKRIAPRFASSETAAAEQSRSVFGATVTPDEKMKQTYASQFGASAADLEKYSRGTATVEDIPAMGSLNIAALQDPEERLKEARLGLLDAETDEEKMAFKEKIDEINGAMNYGTDPKTLQAEVNRVSIMLEDETDPAKVAMLNKKLNSLNERIKSNTVAQAKESERAKEFGDSPRTWEQLKKMVEGAQVAALEEIGITDNERKRIIVETPDGLKYRRKKLEDRPEIASVARNAALDALRSSGYIKPDGTIEKYAIDVLISLGLYVGGKIIPDPMENKTAGGPAGTAGGNAANEKKQQASAAVAQGKAPPPSTPSSPPVVVKNWN
jgi:hypothetical protein